MKVVRTDEQIERLDVWAMYAQDKGTNYPNQIYEDGVRDTLDWLFGREDISPSGEGTE
jgi:hypothetical protein